MWESAVSQNYIKITQLKYKYGHMVFAAGLRLSADRL